MHCRHGIESFMGGYIKKVSAKIRLVFILEKKVVQLHKNPITLILKVIPLPLNEQQLRRGASTYE